MSKKTTEEELISLYDVMLRGYLQNAYVVHCTDSKRVVEASNSAMNAEYKENLRVFKDKINELGNKNFRCIVHGRVSPKIVKNLYQNDWSSWLVRCPYCSREVLKP